MPYKANKRSDNEGDTPPKRPAKLSAAFVKTATRPGRYGDGYGGHGLSLLIKPRKGGGISKTWSQRVRIEGRPVNIGLGSYPVVMLADAREAALANRRAIWRGRDPREKPSPGPTFEEAAEALIALRQQTWQTGKREAKIWRSSLRDYVMPAMGGKRLGAITTADVLAVLTPLWGVRHATALRVRQRISSIMRWAVAQGHRTDNPAGQAISQALPKNRAPLRHHRTFPYAEVGAALAKIRRSGAYAGIRLCLEFLALTVVRSGEARGAHWEEIHPVRRIWDIPAARMKARRPHRVPLSTGALAALDEAREIRDGSGLVFPSARGLVMGDGMLSGLMHDLDIPAVPHGFRSAHRQWAGEMTDASRAVMEAVLAHKLGDAAEQAYARSDLFEKRRTLLQKWSDFIDSTTPR